MENIASHMDIAGNGNSNYDTNNHSSNTTGMSGKSGTFYVGEQNGHPGSNWYLGGGGSGGGYPYGGGTSTPSYGYSGSRAGSSYADSSKVFGNEQLTGTASIQYGGSSNGPRAIITLVRAAYKMTVQGNTGKIGGADSKVYEVVKGAGDPATIDINEYKKNGYNFDGIWTQATEGQQIYNAQGSKVNDGTYWKNENWDYSDNVTFYVHWKLETKNITGKVKWDDSNNKYSLRPANVTVTLHRTPTTGVVTALPSPATVNKPSSGNETTYTFNNVQSKDTTTGNDYTYTVSQNAITGYETIINGFEITNRLVVPTYTSSIEYAPVDSLDGAYLRNGRVKVTATAKANEDNMQQVGLWNGTVTLNVDNDIQIDKESIKIVYTDGETGEKTTITDYNITGNQIVVKFGKDSNGESEKSDTITIEVEGILGKIGQYTSSMKLEGKLRNYQGINVEANLGKVTEASKQLTVEYQMPKANISIIKTDSITEERLTDAEFTLYEWNGSNYIEKETIIDDNNDGIYVSQYYEWKKTTDGKYKIVETKLPDNHKDLNFSMEYRIDQLKTENYTITPDYDNETYEIEYGIRQPDDFNNINGTIENEPYKLKVSIETIDSETKEQIVSETEFAIYEWNKESQTYEQYVSYTDQQEVKMERQEDGTYLSTQWLYYTSKNEGNYRIIETKAPVGYYGDYQNGESKEKRNYDINISEIVKSGDYEGQKVTNESTIKVGNNGEKLENQRIINNIEVTEIDSQNKTIIPQGDAEIEGTIYGLYAKEKIHHADGVTATKEDETALLYRKDELVQSQTIDEEGKLTFCELECGEYYIKEIEAGEGYLADENEYDVDLTYRNEENLIITEEETVEETVKKQGIQITKYRAIEDNEYEVITNAGFTIYRVEELSIVKEGKIKRVTKDRYELLDEKALKDPIIARKVQSGGTYKLVDLVDYYYRINYTHEGTQQELPNDGIVYNPYNMEKEQLVMNYAEGSEGIPIEELELDDNGQLESPELAYGEYVVLETSVPLDCDVAVPFILNIEKDSRQLQSMRFIIDPNFEARVKIYKTDDKTKENVIGKTAKYVIRNLDTDQLVTNIIWTVDGYKEEGSYETPYETGSEGFLITPVKLEVGNYEIEEIEAPEGYVLNGYEGNSNRGETELTPKEKIQFEIMGNAAYCIDEGLNEIVVVQKQENQAQVGSIKIETVGEYIKKIENGEITYEEGGVARATYEIVAKEDIISQDNQTTLYTAGEVVQTVTSNSEGIAYAENLPIGTYYVRQTVAGEGFKHNTEEKEITIGYEQGENGEEASKTPVIFKTTKFRNERQKLDIEIEKQDENNQAVLPGAIFGIYAKENILGRDGTIVKRENELIETVTTNENGIAEFSKEIPLGKYYIKELKAPEGYILREEIIEINGNYQTDQREINSIKEVYTNNKTSINAVKTNIEGEQISGAILQIQDQQGTVVQEWETGENPQGIEGLGYDKEYRLVEKTPAPGYVTANEISFKLNSQGKIGEGEEVKDTITMVDERTKIQIDVVDKETKEKLEGMEFEIVKETKDEEGNVIKEEIVGEFTTSSEESYYTEGLPIGEYILRQKEITDEDYIQKGYVTMKRKEFTIKDVTGVQEIVIEQELSQIKLEFKDAETGEVIEDLEDVHVVIKDEEGNVVEDLTGEDINGVIEGLPHGKYTLELLDPPPEYKSLTLEIVVEDEQGPQTITVESDPVNKAQIEIVDGETGEKIEDLEDVHILIRDEEGNVVEDVTGEDINNVIKGLDKGEYTLELLNPPYGYESTTETIVIEDKYEIQAITIKLERQEFDLKIDHWIQKIERNGQVEYESTQPEDQAIKIEVSNKNIKTDDIRITYRIQVSNPSKVAGKVTRLEMNIPGCMRFYPQDNIQYCQEKNGKVSIPMMEQVELKENDSVYVDVVLRWKNEQEAFGLNKTIAEIKETDNKLHFEESNFENNKSEAEIVIGIKTGMVISTAIIVMIIVSLGICGYVITITIKNRKYGPNINKIKFLYK